jgi:hypothetical protein
MRNIKLEQNLDGDEHWPFITTLKVAGSSTATPVPDGATQPDLENVIQSWNDIAVLNVTPETEFYFGFMIDDQSQFLNIPIATEDGKFGVHVGNSDVVFLVFAKDMKTKLTLELVDRVDVNDENYQSLPLY